MSKATAAAAAYPTPFAMIALTDISPSTFNPRKHFNEAALEELTKSVEVHGILEPILVRPVATGYEIVAGERRYRAALRAALREIPALIRELDDKAALELAVIENLQREDLHPLEEAEGYEQLHTAHGYTADELAAKVGKGKGYVYGRMKLLALTPASREAFYEGKLSPSTALLLARIPLPELQEKALQDITNPNYKEEPLTFREASDHIQRRFMLRLENATWDITDAELVPAAGACATCPKRTGNQRELFSDVQSPDLCTDPACYESKRDALWGRRKAATKPNETVIEDKQAKKLFENYDGGGLKFDVGYIDLGARCEADPKFRNWRDVLGKEAAPLQRFIVRNPNTGNVHELLAAGAAHQVLKAKLGTPSRSKPKQAASKSGQSSPNTKAQAEADANEARRKALLKTILDKIVADVEKDGLSLKAQRFMATELFREAALMGESLEGLNIMAERRGMKFKLTPFARMTAGGEEAAYAYIRKCDATRLESIVFELSLLVGGADTDFIEGDTGPTNNAIDRAAELFGINVSKLEAQAKAAEDEKKALAAAAPAAKGKSKPAAKAKASKAPTTKKASKKGK